MMPPDALHAALFRGACRHAAYRFMICFADARERMMPLLDRAAICRLLLPLRFRFDATFAAAAACRHSGACLLYCHFISPSPFLLRLFESADIGRKHGHLPLSDRTSWHICYCLPGFYIAPPATPPTNGRHHLEMKYVPAHFEPS